MPARRTGSSAPPTWRECCTNARAWTPRRSPSAWSARPRSRARVSRRARSLATTSRSSSCGCRASEPLDRGGIVDELEALVEACDVEDPVDGVGAADDRHAAAAVSGALVGADQGAQPGRVHEGQAAQVDDQYRRLVRLQIAQGLLQDGRAGYVQLAPQGQAGLSVRVLRVEFQ